MSNNIINWSGVSRYLTGNKDSRSSIRSNHKGRHKEAADEAREFERRFKEKYNPKNQTNDNSRTTNTDNIGID